MIPLEDLFNDVVSKAQRGLGLTDETLASRAGISVGALAEVKDGKVDEPVLRAVAPVLHLHAGALVIMARKSWKPTPVALRGLIQINTNYDDMTVNSYIVYDPETREAAAFDSGADAQPMLAALKEHDLTLKDVYLTHTHGDHVADLSTLRKNREPLHACAREPWQGADLFDCGKEFFLGNLTIHTRQTWGHSRGGVTFVIRGLAHPVAIVGDALFASSMGGGMISYADALRTNRQEIFSLPSDTVVCPGHGPLTTVGEEKEHNPFYPEYK